MRYIDNGTGDPREDALFPWLRTVLTADVVAIRWQSGFFEATVLGVFTPSLQRLAYEELDASILIGSNDGGTQSSAVHQLVDLLGLPRPGAHLGVVNYADGLYHPKTIHICYRNGREVAYVGSANMTSRGINGLNVEAGIVFDTDDGDPVELLADIKQATQEWFVSHPQGLFKVENHDDVNRLALRGILKSEYAPRQPPDVGTRVAEETSPHRRYRHALPSIEEPKLDEPVLIAELAGPGRWGQAAFPEWFINSFFEVLPNTGDVLRLVPVTQADGVGVAEEAACGFKAGSKNWYYELGLAAAIGAYPNRPYKPIGVFHRVTHQTFRYTILMPDDESYAEVSGCLSANLDRLQRPGNELPRTIVPASVLRDAWHGNWFFEA